MKTQVFRFIKNVQHEPAPQFVGYKVGDVIIVDGVAYGPKIIDGGRQVSVITGHGTSDEFLVGEEVELLSDEDAKPYLKERALKKLTEEERTLWTS